MNQTEKKLFVVVIVPKHSTMETCHGPSDLIHWGDTGKDVYKTVSFVRAENRFAACLAVFQQDPWWNNFEQHVRDLVDFDHLHKELRVKFQYFVSAEEVPPIEKVPMSSTPAVPFSRDGDKKTPD